VKSGIILAANSWRNAAIAAAVRRRARYAAVAASVAVA
jgi:hypothetical protein